MIYYADNVDELKLSQIEGFFAGWKMPVSPELHLQILQSSYAVWLAFDNDKCVGFINSVSDGFFYAGIPLLEVLPEYRGNGIGTELVKRMLTTLESLYAVDIVCDHSLTSFYSKHALIPSNSMIKRNFGYNQ